MFSQDLFACDGRLLLKFVTIVIILVMKDSSQSEEHWNLSFALIIRVLASTREIRRSAQAVAIVLASCIIPLRLFCDIIGQLLYSQSNSYSTDFVGTALSDACFELHEWVCLRVLKWAHEAANNRLLQLAHKTSQRFQYLVYLSF